MLDPEAGDVIPGTGGLRKLRVADERRGKGKRGGLRVMYYWWHDGNLVKRYPDTVQRLAEI